MIVLLFRLALAISTNTACDYGKPADYYQWVAAHPAYHAMDLSSREHGDIWLMSDDGEHYLFKFAEPIADTIASGASHGECFNYVGSLPH